MTNTINHDKSEPKVCLINIFLITTSVLIGIIFIWCFYYYKAAISNEQNIKEVTGKSYAKQKRELYEKEHLNKLSWLNKEKSEVKIPLNEAIKLVIKDYN